MKSKRDIAMTVSMLLLICGCSVTGKWSLASVDPEAARRDFQYQTLTLQKDGTFFADAEEAGIKTTSGTYRYEDGVLFIKEHDGEQHTYDAKLASGGKRLVLEEFWQGRRLTAEFQRKEQPR